MEFKPLKIGSLTAKIPLIQGGMGVGVSLAGLAGAVGLNGGIGIISTAQIGFQEPDFDKNPIEANLRAVKKQIERAKEIAKGGIIGVNIMVATKYYEKYVKAALKAGADIIISGAGLPVLLPKYAAGFQAKIAPIVSSVKSARVIMKLWETKHNRLPDFIVIEGPRAGGHLGFKQDDVERFTVSEYDQEITNIISFVKGYEEKYQKKIPVITAGGIYSKEDVLHQIELGADGVQMGTRFVTTEECDAHIKYKEAYLKATQEDIRIVKSPVGMPGRAVYNDFLKKQNKLDISKHKCHQCLEKCNPKLIPYCITDALIEAVKGNVDNGLIFCGDNAYKSQKIETVPDIISEIFIN